MNTLFIDTLIKNIFLYLVLSYCFIKIVNYTNMKPYKSIFLLIITIVISLVQFYLQDYTLKFYRLFTIYFIYGLILSRLTKLRFTKSLLVTLLSMAISHMLLIFSGLIISGLITILYKPITNFGNPIIVLSVSVFTYILSYLLFKIKRFKHGIPFLKNNSENNTFDIIILILNMIVIFTYFFIAYLFIIPVKTLVLSLLFFAIVSAFVFQKMFFLYHKQKLQTQALKDYEQELAEVKEKLSTAIAEKEKLVKSNHEFYHRQKALGSKIDNLIAQQKLLRSVEFGEDINNLQNRIQKLSNEYVSKTTILPKLAKTNIVEIDDMLSYLQSECSKNHIEFVLKIECDIHNIIDKYISQSQLETLLGDLIGNAIIAINHSQNSFKSIMAIIGIKDENYEICVYDSGIPFETATLVNIGLNPASTHIDEGGTGIGFITTFETLNSCNASFIINEITNNNYSKSLEIKFDNRHEYVIISKRKKEIENFNIDNRKIIIKE